MSDWQRAQVEINQHQISYLRTGGDKPPIIYCTTSPKIVPLGKRWQQLWRLTRSDHARHHRSWRVEPPPSGWRN